MSMRELLKKRLEESYRRKEQSNRGSFFKKDLDIKFWSCKEGEHLIDIIPYRAGRFDPNVPEGEETYKLEIYVHSNVGVTDDSIICLAKTYGKRCPICEYRKKLQSEDVDEDEIRRLLPSKWPRVIYNIVCYDSEEEITKGVQVWHTSYFLMEKQLLELARKPVRPGKKEIDPFIVFPDPKEGKSISFKREGTGRNTRFVGIKFVDRDYEISKEILESAYVLDELIHIPTYDEVRDLFFGTEEAETKMEEKAEETEEETGEKVCPAGGTFGKDVDMYDECENCSLWEECAKMAEEKEEEEE